MLAVNTNELQGWLIHGFWRLQDLINYGHEIIGMIISEPHTD